MSSSGSDTDDDVGVDHDDSIWEILDQLSLMHSNDDVTHTTHNKSTNKNSSSESSDKGSNNGPQQLQLLCSFCKSDSVILDDGNYVCHQCGTVTCRFLDASAEWRFYGNDDNKGSDPTRCGMPINELLPEASMGCVIGFGTKESPDMRMIRKYHIWNCMTYKERSLYNIFDTLTVNAVNNGIPKSIIEEAKMLYKKISEMKISRGDNRSGLIASSIYMSCKTHKVPRSTKEIAKIFNLKPTVMTRGCKKFQEIMKMNMHSTQPEDFICRFCSKLFMDQHMRNLCMRIVKTADELSIVSENTPPSIAAGSIFLCSTICDWGISKKDLAEACEISQVTISKCFKKLSLYMQHLFPEALCKEYGIPFSKITGKLI